MGAQDEYQDTIAREDWASAFGLALQILNRKSSKRLMHAWIEACIDVLEHLGKASLLPEYFYNLSVYGQADELNKIQF